MPPGQADRAETLVFDVEVAATLRSKARTVNEYLADLPEDRPQALAEVREVILSNLPDGYQEGMQYSMVG